MSTTDPVTPGYRTSDMGLAAFLKVSAVPFIDVDRGEGNDGRVKVWFVFEDMGNHIMRDLKRQFFSGKAKVSAMELYQALKWAKMLTHME